MSTRNAAAYRLGVLSAARCPRRSLRFLPSERVSIRMLFGGSWLQQFRRGYRDGKSGGSA